MIAWIRHALRSIEAVIWPKRLFCLTCDEPVEEMLLCPECMKILRGIRFHMTGNLRSVFLYEHPASTLVKALKDDSMLAAAQVMADVLAEEARTMELPPDTVITWVTTQKDRIRYRGIDHGREIASRVGALTGLTVRKLLRRTRRSRTQRGLSAEQRRKNLLGVFDCPETLNCPVLIIDDVYTTGTTIHLASEALMRAGAKQVFALTVTKVA